MLKNYFISAIRNSFRSKLSTFIGLLGFTVGLLFVVMLFHFITNEITFDKYFNGHEKVFRVLANFNNARYDATAEPIAEKLKNEFSQVRFSSHYVEKQCNVGSDRNFSQNPVQFVDEDFFNIFSVKTNSGNLSKFNDIENIVALSRRMVNKIFHDKNPIGKTINVELGNGLTEFEVVSEFEDLPSNSSFHADIVIPFNNYTEKIFNPHGDWLINQFGASFFVKLDNKNSKSFLEKQLNNIIKSNVNAQYSKVYKYVLQPIDKIHYDNDVAFNKVVPSNKNYMLILLVLTLFIIVIVSINYSNLVIAKSYYRIREIGVRKTFGAKKSNIILQFVTESFLIVIAAFFIALLLSPIFQPVFNSLMGENIKLEMGLNLSTVILILFVVTVSILVGLLPAVRLFKYTASSIFSGNSLAVKGKLMAKIFIGIQFAIAVFLLFGALILNMQFNFMTNKNLGYNKNLVVMIKTEEIFGRRMDAQTVRSFRNDIITNSSIQDASVCNMTLGGKPVDSMFRFDNNNRYVFSSLFNTDRDLFGTLNIKFKEGRNFNDYDDNTNSVIVNEEFIKRLMLAKPLESEIALMVGSKVKQMKIIGVVNDFYYKSMRDSIAPIVFINQGRKSFSEFIYVKIKNADISNSISILKDSWNKYFPEHAFEYQFLDEHIDKLYKSELRWKNIINYSAFSSILFVCFGLFALVLYSVERRTKEIGIRKVLGASVMNIVRLFIREYLIVLLSAFIFAVFPAYYFSNKWLEDYAYRVEPGLNVFVLTALIIFTITFATISFHAVKAAVANPVESLRYE